MDAGCYAVHIVRTLAGAEPTVVRARPCERTARASTAPMGPSWRSPTARPAGCAARCGRRAEGRGDGGGRGRDPAGVQPAGPTGVQPDHRRAGRAAATSGSAGGPTYDYQLAAFAAAVRDGTPTLTPPADSVANMRVIDAIYRAAGLEVRTPTPV